MYNRFAYRTDNNLSTNRPLKLGINMNRRE